MEQYVTVDNLKTCEVKFRAYMATKHSVEFSAAEAGTLKRTLYGVMSELKAKHSYDDTLTLKELNNLTLNIARDLVLRDRGGGGGYPPQAPAGGRLDRDTALFGNRRVAFNTIVPADTEGKASAVSKAFDAAMGERRMASNPVWSDVSKPVVTDDAMGEDEFSRRMAAMTHDRERQVQTTLPEPPPKQPFGRGDDVGDPQAVLRSAMAEVDDFRSRLAATTEEPMRNYRAEALMPALSAGQRTTTVRYIAINGFDRDWVASPQRYSYTIRADGGDSVGALLSTYKNIEWLEASRVVLPMEITLPATLGVANNGYFNHQFSFAYPYVALAVRGFDSMYDGTNEGIRRAFCLFVFHRAYKAPNGRGYVVLEPAQGERLVFKQPLASLRDMTLSLYKPNGTLVNQSVDNYTIQKLEYFDGKRLLIKVVCDQYFDKNEYYPGDAIMIRGFWLDPPRGDPDPTAYTALNEYINRPSGHEVVELGPSNTNGFCNTFFVLAPGVLDQLRGTVEIDERLKNAVKAMSNVDVPKAEFHVDADGRRTKPRLLNMSLQNLITMRVGVQTSNVGSVVFADTSA
jgi:hypothetical protein